MRPTNLIKIIIVLAAFSTTGMRGGNCGPIECGGEDIVEEDDGRYHCGSYVYCESWEECCPPTGLFGGLNHCADISSSPHDCGGCGIQCAVDAKCVEGSCYCKVEGLTHCTKPGFSVSGTGYNPEECVDLESNPRHCGGCGNWCGCNSYCQGGKCYDVGTILTECEPYLGFGSSVCVDIETDAEHCGECYNECGENSYCSNGECISE
jgi:hypothetical protein